MKKEIILCEKSGIEQIYLSTQGGDAAHAYFTANCWAGNDFLILARMKNTEPPYKCELVLTNINTGEEQILTDKATWSSYIVQDGFVYHFTENEIYQTEISSGKTEHLWTGDSRYILSGPPSLTADSRYLSIYWEDEKSQTSINRFDLKTGKMEEFCRISFPAPFHIANHCMLNPQNPDEMFFSHEGNCNYVTNRLWLADFPSHSARNLFKQKMDNEGGNGEACGHEMWAPDGKGIYFIKYPCATMPPRGMYYFDLEKNDGFFVAGKYSYWHSAVSPLGNALAADTQISGNYSEVVYINPEEKTERIVAVPHINWTHPCHPHPQFSPDGKRICYTCLGGDGRLAVGIASGFC